MQKSSLSIFLILILMIANTGCKLSESEAIAIVTQETDSIFSSLFAPNEPGAAVVIMHDDSIIYAKGFGMADLEKNEPINMNTAFNICSISKQFAAMALLRLAEDSLISLDQPITDYFPNLTQPFFQDVKLHHMLSHTSGIPDSRPRNREEWEDYRKLHKSKFKTIHDYIVFSEEDESWLYLEDLEKLNFVPGTAYEYMNPTFQMMLSIVEQATEDDFDNWMKENIFEPSGMENTVYFQADRIIPNMAHGYEPAEGENVYGYFRSADGKWEESDYGEAGFFATKADGGLYTTPLDFMRWDQAVYGDSIVMPESLELAHTGKIDTDIPHTRYGYGWFIENRPDRPEKIYHTGDNGGFHTFAGRFSKQGLSYLIFANRNDWNREEVVEKMDRIFEKVGWLDAPEE